MYKVIFICALFPMISLWAQSEIIGRVTQTKGNVFRDSNENKKAVKKLFKDETFLDHKTEEPMKTGDQLFSGDKITTREKSFAQMTLLGKTVFTLGPESSLVLNSRDFYQENGLLHTIVPHGNPDQIKVRTPHVAMGIRGTEFMTQVKVDHTNVALLSGLLAIKTDEVSSILSPKNIQQIAKHTVKEAIAINDSIIFQLLKNSVKEGLDLDPNLYINETTNEPESNNVPKEEGTLRKTFKAKTWQEILEANQNKR
ncbi:MAG: FecR domain-containing protein [Bacteriovoracaceae bacterium]